MAFQLLQNMPSDRVNVKGEWTCIFHDHSLSHYGECILTEEPHFKALSRAGEFVPK